MLVEPEVRIPEACGPEAKAEVCVLGLQSRPATTGILLSAEGSRLRIGYPEMLAPGTLVEVSTDKRVYLGFVSGAQDGELLVEAEHELERSSLNAIQAVWGASARGSNRITGGEF